LRNLQTLTQADRATECAAVVIVGSRREATDAILDGLFGEDKMNAEAVKLNGKDAKLLLAVLDPGKLLEKFNSKFKLFFSADHKDVEGRCCRALQIINDVYSSKIRVISLFKLINFYLSDH
jgi:hypothetical protein